MHDQFDAAGYLQGLCGNISRPTRDIERLTRAAWGVGATHEWFRKASRDTQEAKVREWVAEAMQAAATRRSCSGGRA